MATDKHEEFAVIEDPGYGCRDAGRPILWFGVKMLSGGSLIVLEKDEANALIENAHIREVHDLNGKPCIVTVDGLSVNFARLHK